MKDWYLNDPDKQHLYPPKFVLRELASQNELSAEDAAENPEREIASTLPEILDLGLDHIQRHMDVVRVWPDHTKATSAIGARQEVAEVQKQLNAAAGELIALGTWIQNMMAHGIKEESHNN